MKIKVGTIIGLAIVGIAGFLIWRSGLLGGRPAVAAPPTGVSEADIQSKINEIKSDPEWMTYIESQATQFGTTVEHQLRGNAIYCLQTGEC